MRIIDTWTEKRRNRAAYRQLSELGDHLLRDVGVSRDDLYSLRRGRGLPER